MVTGMETQPNWHKKISGGAGGAGGSAGGPQGAAGGQEQAAPAEPVKEEVSQI